MDRQRQELESDNEILEIASSEFNGMEGIEIGGALTMAKLAKGRVGQRLVATARLRCLYIVPGKLGWVGLLGELWLWCFEKLGHLQK